MPYNRRPPIDYVSVLGGRGTGSNPDPALEVQGDVLANHNLSNRIRGFNALPRRFELRWVAGQHGKPGLTALLTNSLANYAITDRDFEIAGTNSTSLLCTYNPEGGITLTTAGASADQMILQPHTAAANTTPWTATTWGSDQQTAWECEITSGSTVANSAVYWAGLKLTNTGTQATDADQAFFRGVGAANWQAMYSIGDVDTTVDTGVALTASTTYHLKVALDDSRVPRFYINGQLVATGTALTDATDFIPYIGIQASSAAARALTVRGAAISRAFA